MIDNFKSSVPKKPVPDTDITKEVEPLANTGSVFKTPEEMAATTIEDDHIDMSKEFAPKKPPHKKRFRLSRKQWLLIGTVLLLIVASFCVYWFAWRKTPVKKEVVVVKKVAVAPKPTTEPSHLTGVTVPIEMNQMPVTGIMIENSPDARPQSGLKDAGVVFEAVAEGGITRFLALFQEAQPDYIGPVRSARPYYLDWLSPFDAALAHVGGSPDALAAIKSLGIKDLDQFFNSGAYQRISSRYAPHNVYTSRKALRTIEQQKGFNGSNFTGFTRKKEAPLATPTAKTIDLTMSGYLYNVHYDYDTASNSYLRSEGSKPHIDERSKAQLSPKVVVALVLPYSVAADGIHSIYGTTGSGKAYYFQDGGVTEGTWEKTGTKNQFVLKDAAGNTMSLNPGQTWFTMVSSAGAVVYKP